MAQIESIATSPYFAIFLALVGTWLFILLSREFSSWFFKIGHFENEMKEIKIQLEEIRKNTLKTPSLKTTSLPPIPNQSASAHGPSTMTSVTEVTKNQFPVQH